MSEPCKPQRFRVNAPTDAEAARLWDQCMKLAEQGCLIVYAYGGVATLSMPEEQRKNGVREMVLQAHERNEVQR